MASSSTRRGFRCSIRKFTPRVYSQKEEANCIQLASTDMITTVHRMNGRTKLLLSPQIFIDNNCDNVDTIKSVVIDPLFGLQSVRDYPYTSFRSPCIDGIRYQEGPRYNLDDLEWTNNRSQIKDFILENFSDNGYKYPMLAGLVLGDLKNSEVAKEAWSGTPFNHPYDAQYHKKLLKEPNHTLLILGVDTMADNPKDHYCVVKNTYGRKWGEAGFTKISFDVILIAVKPVYLKKNLETVCLKRKKKRSRLI